MLLDDSVPGVTGYLVAAASTITPASVNSFATFAGGIVCAAVPSTRLRELGIPRMSAQRLDFADDFCVSVEAREGVTTGISAKDRARTLQVLATTKEPRLDLVTPGHIFPIRAIHGGLLVRSAPAEAAVDLMKIAELPEHTAAFAACLSSQGQLANHSELCQLSDRLQIERIAISEIVQWRMTREVVVEKIADVGLPTHAGKFRAICYRSLLDSAEHLALTSGDLGTAVESGTPILVRVQAENRLGDLLGLEGPSSRQSMFGALKHIQTEGLGLFVYVQHPRKGNITQQVRALETPNISDSNAQLRELGVGAQILKNLGITKVRLLTNSSRQVGGINAFGIEITERINFKIASQ